MIPLSTELPLGALQLALRGALSWMLAIVLLALAGALAWYAYRNTQPAIHGFRRGVLTALRALALLILLFMLAEPILNRSESTLVKPGVLLLSDTSGSMAIESTDGRSRAHAAQQLRGALQTALSQRGDELRLFTGEGGQRLIDTREANDVQKSPEELMHGEGTNLEALLLSSAQRYLEENLQAIVLFSDGVTTAAEPPSLGGLRTPVFCVAVGDTVGPVDLRLDRVRYPSLVYRGETVVIEGEVVADDVRPGSTTATLSGPEGQLASLVVEWPAGGGRVPISFELRADSLGMAGYLLGLAPVVGEPLDQNNAVQVGFEVRKDRLRLMQVESRPTWNHHFMARRAAQDARFSFRGAYRAETGWRIAGEDSTWSVPRSLEEAKDIDLWIAGSLDDLAELCDASSAVPEAIEAGAGLLILFGEPARRSLRALPARARALLPLELPQGSRWMQANHRARPTARGLGHPIFAFGELGGDLVERVAAMPPLWEVVYGGRAADDADVLLQAQSGASTMPLLTLRRQGRGHVAAWSGAPLWSWSFWRLGATEGQEVFDALMGNLLYFLAEGGDRSRLQLILPRPVVSQGEDVAMRGLALDPRLQPDDASDIWLEWTLSDMSAPDSLAAAIGRARMEPDSRTPGGRLLPLPALPSGNYRVRLALEEGEERIVSPWRELVIDPYSVEYQNPRVDRSALRRLAQSTGGRLLERAELGEWAQQTVLEPKEAVLTGRIELWASLWLFLPFLGLITLEWALRKRWGLV